MNHLFFIPPPLAEEGARDDDDGGKKRDILCWRENEQKIKNEAATRVEFLELMLNSSLAPRTFLSKRERENINLSWNWVALGNAFLISSKRNFSPEFPPSSTRNFFFFLCSATTAWVEFDSLIVHQSSLSRCFARPWRSRAINKHQVWVRSQMDSSHTTSAAEEGNENFHQLFSLVCNSLKNFSYELFIIFLRDADFLFVFFLPHENAAAFSPGPSLHCKKIWEEMS